MCRHVPSFAPTIISPRGTRSVSAMAVRTLLRASSVSSAYFWNSLPDWVIDTFPPERSSSLAPTSSSSARICAEIAGCVRKRFSAAREKLERRATSRKVSSWSKSIIELSAVSFQLSGIFAGRLAFRTKPEGHEFIRAAYAPPPLSFRAGSPARNLIPHFFVCAGLAVPGHLLAEPEARSFRYSTYKNNQFPPPSGGQYTKTSCKGKDCSRRSYFP